MEPLSIHYDAARGSYSGEFLWHNSSEADEHIAVYGLSSETVCWMQIGYAIGYVTTLIGKLIIFREIECRAIKLAFPDARVVSIPVVAQTIEDAYDFKLKYWGKVLGNNAAKTRVKVEPLTEDHIDLEGHQLKILGPMQVDMADSSVVWIPSI